jgi:mitogen-activated protein kinase 15
VWAVGAILGEMLNGRPVFPGSSTMNQIERVIQVTNMPSKGDIDAVASPFAATMLETLPPLNYRTIPETFPSATPDGLDVLHLCLNFNPDRRPSAEELLKHVFVAEFHNEEEEPNFPGGIPTRSCEIHLACCSAPVIVLHLRLIRFGQNVCVEI